MDKFDRIIELLEEQNAMLRQIATTPQTLEAAIARGVQEGVHGRDRDLRRQQKLGGR